MGKLTYSEIKNDIQKAKEELFIANRRFEFADTNEMIDICSLQIEVAKKKCDYLIKLAKEQGMLSDDLLETNVSAVI